MDFSTLTVLLTSWFMLGSTHPKVIQKNQDPETVVGIGFNFFLDKGKKEKKKSNRSNLLGLPPDYPKRVAKVIETRRELLLSCSEFLIVSHENNAFPRRDDGGTSIGADGVVGQPIHHTAIIRIEISSEGRGRIESVIMGVNSRLDTKTFAEKGKMVTEESGIKAEECMKKVLLETQYPSHPLKAKWVRFDLPITLERELL